MRNVWEARYFFCTTAWRKFNNKAEKINLSICVVNIKEVLLHKNWKTLWITKFLRNRVLYADHHQCLLLGCPVSVISQKPVRNVGV